MVSKGNYLTSLLRYGAAPLGLGILVVLLRLFCFLPLSLRTEALAPRYPSGAWLLSLRQLEPQRASCVVLDLSKLKLKQEEPSYILGRVIALPGDSLELRSGQIYVNGQRQPEYRFGEIPREHYALRLPRAQGVYPLDSVNLVAYRSALEAEQEQLVEKQGKADSRKETQPWLDAVTHQGYYTFARDYYWVLCDDPMGGLDSRHLGIIPREAIISVLLFGLSSHRPYLYY